MLDSSFEGWRAWLKHQDILYCTSRILCGEWTECQMDSASNIEQKWASNRKRKVSRSMCRSWSITPCFSLIVNRLTSDIESFLLFIRPSLSFQFLIIRPIKIDLRHQDYDQEVDRAAKFALTMKTNLKPLQYARISSALISSASTLERFKLRNSVGLFSSHWRLDSERSKGFKTEQIELLLTDMRLYMSTVHYRWGMTYMIVPATSSPNVLPKLRTKLYVEWVQHLLLMVGSIALK